MRASTPVMSQATPATAVLLLLPLALLPSGCLRMGGGLRTTFDTESGKPTIAATGQMAGFALADLLSDPFDSTAGRSGVFFSLGAGAAYDTRVRGWQGLFGPRIGWLWPGGVSTLGVEGRIGANPEQQWGVVLTTGPRFELSRSQDNYQRRAIELNIPVSAGFMAGGGFRPEIGLGVEAHRLFWSRGGSYH